MLELETSSYPTTNNFGAGYIPSIDFNLFRLPQFGELFADSLGLASNFNSNYPTDYVNYSVNSLASILQPQQPLSMPSLPNYGQGVELPNIINLAPLITPTFFQGNAPKGSNAPTPYYDPPQIFSVPQMKTSPDTQAGSNQTTVNVYPFPTQAGQTPINTGKKCPEGESEYSDVFGFKHCGKSMVSDGSGSGDKRVIGDDATKSGDKVQTIADFFKTLPAGSGIFLIAVAVIVLILLFARK